MAVEGQKTAQCWYLPEHSKAARPPQPAAVACVPPPSPRQGLHAQAQAGVHPGFGVLEVRNELAHLLRRAALDQQRTAAAQPVQFALQFLGCNAVAAGRELAQDHPALERRTQRGLQNGKGEHWERAVHTVRILSNAGHPGA
jgi:hypothetical protein